ncbi:hypothetical protein E4631_10110 [Hymenobacter sp. UV11]|uniref:hypothetical protein n=1 Tax=Hymenobacter sp. UV11 TaxID=1849735 RepID=UPI00105FDAED|nr:hypothetical protein [Hymenobacter sp. UV11]TDN40612.1 hypothetical protein A8B98_14435 [Hymenobacter sp. UV11]TFZ66368.1 hypothetical protein E4631_10110 [Hymenobacter sp. UV11]
MKYLLTLLWWGSLLPAQAQQPQFTVHNLRLPKEVAYYDNQFSGLAASADKLYLLSESRLQDQAEAKLYTVRLADLDRQLADTTYVLPYQKLPITGLPALRTKMAAAGQRYEGLEAMLLVQDVVYLSVETDTPSSTCYLLKGQLRADAVVLDTTFLLPLAKPLAADDSHIYNAGFEALAEANDHLLAFFEYNSFPARNYTYYLDNKNLSSASAPGKLPITQLPFRITDITAASKNRFTALNFFFKGEGGDAIYRTPAGDLPNAQLIRDGQGYKNYSRLLTIELSDNKLTWQPLWEFPEKYRGYNWEGIAAYKGGYFVINDKYTPSRPYQTTLLYLQPVK